MAAGASWTRRAVYFTPHMKMCDIWHLGCSVCVQDPEGFVEDGGWSFLDLEGSVLHMAHLM